MKNYLTTALLISLCFFSKVADGQPVLNAYISEAFNNNLVLQDKKVSLEKSLVSLKEARSMFLPTTWFEGQYTLAKGGRTIDIPVGDLVNPVYKTLNQLTGSNGFRSISNVSEQLLPNNFYDARIKTTMPVINPQLKYNRVIKEQQTLLEQNEIDRYKRELVLQTKVAYYNYLMAKKSIAIYQNALEIVNENLRTNQSLLKNGKGLPAYVARSASEVKTVESQLEDARNQQKNAQAYFNFLLNKDLNIPIETNESEMAAPTLSALGDALDVAQREELKGIAINKQINVQVTRMNKSFATPRLHVFLDLASQARDFKVGSKTVFYFGGLQVQVPIYTGKRNIYKIEQSNLDTKSLDLVNDNAKKQLELSAYTSKNNVSTAFTTYAAALKQQEAAQSYFKLIDRGYKEGVNSFIEFLDARIQVTNAQLQVNINQYKFLSSLADYERQTASYSIN